MNRDGYIQSLLTEARRYLKRIERLLGPRDSRFVLGTIGLADCKEPDGENPRTYFPNGYSLCGGCVVDILITKCPWERFSPDQGRWQVAHECVHLLDPVIGGTANVLEEGLATWFQDEPRFHSTAVRQYIQKNTGHTPKYLRARDLVRSYAPDLQRAVKTIRSHGVPISSIMPELLIHHLPQMKLEDSKELCLMF